MRASLSESARERERKREFSNKKITINIFHLLRWTRCESANEETNEETNEEEEEEDECCVQGVAQKKSYWSELCNMVARSLARSLFACLSLSWVDMSIIHLMLLLLLLLLLKFGWEFISLFNLCKNSKISCTMLSPTIILHTHSDVCANTRDIHKNTTLACLLLTCV